MRQILRQHELTADSWRYPGEEGSGMQVLPLPELLRVPRSDERGPLAVWVAPTDDVLLLSNEVPRLALIVIYFEKSGDGRGYSQAQVLRQQLQYRGELRASGALKRDQVFLLARCGFDAFDLDPSEDAPAARAQLARFSVAHQRATDTLVRLRQRESV